MKKYMLICAGDPDGVFVTFSDKLSVICNVRRVAWGIFGYDVEIYERVERWVENHVEGFEYRRID